MTKFEAQNIQYTGYLKNNAARGSIISSDGLTFIPSSATANNQILVSSTGGTGGVAWSIGAQGLGSGFGIYNGITPSSGNTSYFLVATSSSFVPCIPVLSGRIAFFSTRPAFSGWTNNPTVITGGTWDYTFGYISSNAEPTTANFVPYAGAPHFQVLGTQINSSVKNFASFTTALSIPVTAGDQIAVRIVNNLTFSGPQPGNYRNQNASLLLRFT